MKKPTRLLFLTIGTVLTLILSSCNLPSRAIITITITNHENGESVVLGEETRIVSLATAPKGVESVELYINGERLETATPAEGTPREFTADQPWTPQQEGNTVITVVAYDAKGRSSDPVSIALQVVQSLSEVSVTPTVTLTPEGLDQTQTAQVGCTNKASFVSDVTIPANSYLTASSNFTKIWRVENTGTCDWIGYQLVHASGDLMSANSPQAIPMVDSGANADLSVDMSAPGSPGTYTAAWVLRASDGSVFGPELSVTIIVPETPTDTPNPTSTATSTATPTNTETSAPISVSQEGDQLSLSAGSTVNTTVNCPAGSVVVSGGYAANDGVRVWHSMMDGNGWRVYATNTTGGSKLVNIYAVCLHNSGGSTSLELSQQNANANDWTQIVADCPGGSVVTGGGWVIGTNTDITLYNSSKSGNGWQVYIDNAGGATPLINAYAICLSGSSGTTQSVSDTSGVVPAGDIEHLVMACPAGSYVTGGGFAVNTGATIYNESITGNAWNVYARNNTGSEKLLYGYGICYSP